MTGGDRRADPESLVEGTLAGRPAAMARLISLVERGGEDARVALRALHPHTGRSYLVGVTGAPGAGKSTLVSRLVGRIRAEGDGVGVLAVDPSSPFSGGAVLGDRVRMQQHATDPEVFIRSMATRGHLGGLAVATRQAARVLDAAGKRWVVVETVGVGQVELDVAQATDTTIVVVNPRWGDSVQVSKAGLLEVADVFAVNKADWNGLAETVRDLRFLLELAPPGRWEPPIVATVASEGQGIDELWTAVLGHRAHLEETGELTRRREARVREELRSIAGERLSERLALVCRGPRFDALVAAVEERSQDPYGAAEELLGAAGLGDR